MTDSQPTYQDCPNLWDPCLELNLDTLWGVDLTGVDLGPAPVLSQVQQQDTIMTGTTDPNQQSVSRINAQIQPQAQAQPQAQPQTTAQNEADREWKTFIGEMMPDRVQLVAQYSRDAQYHQSLYAQQHQQGFSSQAAAASSTSTPTVSTTTPTPMNQFDKLLQNQHPQTPQSKQPATRQDLEKEVNALTRRLALEKDYLCERNNRLNFFSQCLASLREILQHERLQGNDKVGLEEWIADMAVLVHDLRVAIDGDEESIREVEGRLRAVFSELGAVPA
ncbi:hypothetical protein N7509_001782 [Penicillium cosmopolitanum]|uniref:Uncharacterized protein n=1 Tax=Penicillium cosmopolitanum TaxID=1131564 RepID=A0A9W9W7R4_9EURO|nr:uncharacterized protein N7509_001782 [Penicillium cosmopolitanum]KAJ5407899.1 hypothetical protein N7509_001782 [Penicillium cosmopolitanum]